ncbi:MAG: YqgE/AlgH family protein [Filimonas sp.]|nr:YqgE/AlgH family protein [Filimonas sp.]
MDEIKAGTLLIADPFLKDPNFMRSVVFMCEHQAEGSLGFVLNQRYGYTIGDLVSGLEGCTYPVYVGGPVQRDTVHFLHTRPDAVPDGMLLTDNIYWGGDFELLTEMILASEVKPEEVRFFIGYSGWSAGQLEEEMNEKSWLTTYGTRQLVFHKDIREIWPDALKQIGGEYAQLIHYPIDPQLN